MSLVTFSSPLGVVSTSNLPSYSMTIRSATLRADSMSCVTTRAVVRSSAWSLRISSLIRSARIGSSPVVGSS